MDPRPHRHPRAPRGRPKRNERLHGPGRRQARARGHRPHAPRPRCDCRGDVLARPLAPLPGVRPAGAARRDERRGVRRGRRLHGLHVRLERRGRTRRRRAGAQRPGGGVREADDHHRLDRPHDGGAVRRRRRRYPRAPQRQRPRHPRELHAVGRDARGAAVPPRGRRGPPARRAAAQGSLLLHQDGRARGVQGGRAVDG